VPAARRLVLFVVRTKDAITAKPRGFRARSCRSRARRLGGS